MAEHVEDVGLLIASDHAVWDFALNLGAVVVSKDHDFVEWSAARRPSPQIVWVRLGNVPNQILIRRLTEIWGDVVSQLESGASVVEATRR